MGRLGPTGMMQGICWGRTARSTAWYPFSDESVATIQVSESPTAGMVQLCLTTSTSESSACRSNGQERCAAVMRCMRALNALRRGWGGGGGTLSRTSDVVPRDWAESCFW